MKFFFIALGFLTRFPVPRGEVRDERELSGSVIFFPLVGLLLGFVLVLAYAALTPFFTERLVNLSIILILILLTGALHLDGFADTVDGFCSKAKSKEELLRIMKDSRVGAMGVVGLAMLLLFKYELLNGVAAQQKVPALIMMCSLSRWSQVLGCRFSVYARASEGIGRPFIGNIKHRDFYFATVCMLVICLIARPVRGMLIFFLVFASSWMFIKYAHKRIGGMTGDTIGAMSEAAEVLVLLAMQLGAA